ncbi:MAG: glycosyl transferase family 1, partial [Planctomycetota bacterium]
MIGIADYERYIGGERLERIHKKAEALSDHRAVHVSSTYYGGGVAEILDPLSLLMNDAGIKTSWLLIKGDPDFFAVTKKMHNALQGGDIRFTSRNTAVYEETLGRNAMRMNLDDFDRVVIHDPQPLLLIRHFRKTCPWIWRCHIDLSVPNRQVWDYMLSA